MEIASATDWAVPSNGRPFQPTTFVDIESGIKAKLSALEAYRGADDISGEGHILAMLGRLQAKQGLYSQAITSLEQANALKEKTSAVFGNHKT